MSWEGFPEKLIFELGSGGAKGGEHSGMSQAEGSLDVNVPRLRRRWGAGRARCVQGHDRSQQDWTWTLGLAERGLEMSLELGRASPARSLSPIRVCALWSEVLGSH